ncbi:hypothetical protein B0I21_102389 [Sphingobacterium paludis]|uniref:Uncharacterized protein n=1 Tax=Sphingobacterium paludis TaxID=1476465 RepID=A0A4R7D8D7_9SPHI|nr:hypothetical protein B0I21_102389 [Sphingobacterium paludis]
MSSFVLQYYELALGQFVFGLIETNRSFMLPLIISATILQTDVIVSGKWR